MKHRKWPVGNERTTTTELLQSDFKMSNLGRRVGIMTAPGIDQRRVRELRDHHAQQFLHFQARYVLTNAVVDSTTEHQCPHGWALETKIVWLVEYAGIALT